MNDARHAGEGLTEALLAEDRGGRVAVACQGSRDQGSRDQGSRDQGSSEGAAWLMALLDREAAAERRVRQLAARGWQAVAALVPLLALSIFMIRVVADGWVRDAVRAAVLTIGVFAILATFVAMLSTVAWLFRGRGASLSAVERRLAALEVLLRQRG